MWRLTVPVFEKTFGGIAYYNKDKKEVQFPFPLPFYHYISAALVVAAILIGGAVMLWPMLMSGAEHAWYPTIRLSHLGFVAGLLIIHFAMKQMGLEFLANVANTLSCGGMRPTGQFTLVKTKMTFGTGMFPLLILGSVIMAMPWYGSTLYIDILVAGTPGIVAFMVHRPLWQMVNAPAKTIVKHDGKYRVLVCDLSGVLHPIETNNGVIDVKAGRYLIVIPAEVTDYEVQCALPSNIRIMTYNDMCNMDTSHVRLPRALTLREERELEVRYNQALVMQDKMTAEELEREIRELEITLAPLNVMAALGLGDKALEERGEAPRIMSFNEVMRQRSDMYAKGDCDE